jgi:uncharacterized protein (TIGR02145 family)
MKLIDLFPHKIKGECTMKNFIYSLLLALVSTVTISAQPVFYDTVRVYPGWNLIGSISSGPVDSIISTNPPGILASPFYGYSPGTGYSAADSLTELGGYWIKIVDLGPVLRVIFRVPPRFWWEWPNCGTVAYDGRTYTTVLIGDQCWLRENLDVGGRIDGSINQADNGVIEKYCYNDDLANCETYGGLYQWNEAMQYTTAPGAQGICPNGWHIPTSAELQILNDAVGGSGNELKAVGEGTGAGAGTNTSGFSALLAGYRDQLGPFLGIHNGAIFWSSSENTTVNVHTRSLEAIYDDFPNTLFNKPFGLSVRCIKN